MSRVLFVCVGNTGRSVMAERILLRATAGRHEARSAGSRPGSRIEPGVVDALREIGIDATDHVPHVLDEAAVEWADVVVATCDEACPVVPGKRYLGWQIPDAYGLPLEQVRPIRDEIARRVGELADELDVTASG
jgi:protein-tyrosine-phosphatase